MHRIRGRGPAGRVAALVWLGLALPAVAAPGVSDWSGGAHAQARLLALGATGGTDRLAAVQIRLDPGYLTYWRQPGDAGLPPTLDTSASDNVAAVSVAFPAPRVFDEAGATLFGYRDGVTLPLHLTLADPQRPATLDVALSYAVCADICLPGQAHLRLALPDVSDPEAGSVIQAAEAAVPRPASLGGTAPLAVLAVTPAPLDDAGRAKPAFMVAVRAASPATLLVEGPEGWFFDTAAPTAFTPGLLVFKVTAADHPAALPATVDLRLTLVDASGAIEVPAHVDVQPPTP